MSRHVMSSLIPQSILITHTNHATCTPHKRKTPALEARFDTFPLASDETNDVNMANPVCFFDIEIGGQPAGRIEMTVRDSG